MRLAICDCEQTDGTACRVGGHPDFPPAYRPPPGPKMVVCLCAEIGLYVNINTKGMRRGSMLITQALHPFLDHDSHVECGKVYEFDDYELEQSTGVIGRIDRSHVMEIIDRISKSLDISENDKASIQNVLTPLMPGVP